MARADIDRILEMIRDRGGRVTTPRRAIVTALVETKDHITAEELADRVQAAHPDVHRSTVYRTLETLADLGVVEHTHLGHGPAVHHLTEDPHHHLICRSCGAVLEAPSGLLSAVGRRVREDYGFRLDAKHFALSGLCKACA